MRGVLRVSVPSMGMTLGAEHTFFAMVTSFAMKHRDVRVHVELSTRVVDLVRDGYDVALRATYDIQPGLVARTISRNIVIAVASPQYLEENGTPRTLKDLRSHRCLTGFSRGEVPQSSWPTGHGSAHVESSFSSNDLGLLREAAIRGVGIALLPRLLVAHLIESGVLVHVLPRVVEAVHQVAVVYPEREFLPAHVRAFIETLAAWAPALHRPPGDDAPLRERKTSSKAVGI
jgi:DNA-binding transcriptional LysR family regulator